MGTASQRQQQGPATLLDVPEAALKVIWQHLAPDKAAAAALLGACRALRATCSRFISACSVALVCKNTSTVTWQLGMALVDFPSKAKLQQLTVSAPITLETLAPSSPFAPKESKQELTRGLSHLAQAEHITYKNCWPNLFLHVFNTFLSELKTLCISDCTLPLEIARALTPEGLALTFTANDISGMQRLPLLRSLTLSRVEVWNAGADLLAPLTQITALALLHVRVHPSQPGVAASRSESKGGGGGASGGVSGGGGDEGGSRQRGVADPDVMLPLSTWLPSISGLRQLQDVTLEFEGQIDLTPLAPLTALTRLCVLPATARLVPGSLSAIVSLPSLRHVALPTADFGSIGISGDGAGDPKAGGGSAAAAPGGSDAGAASATAIPLLPCCRWQVLELAAPEPAAVGRLPLQHMQQLRQLTIGPVHGRCCLAVRCRLPMTQDEDAADLRAAASALAQAPATVSPHALELEVKCAAPGVPAQLLGIGLYCLSPLSTTLTQLRLYGLWIHMEAVQALAQSAPNIVSLKLESFGLAGERSAVLLGLLDLPSLQRLFLLCMADFIPVPEENPLKGEDVIKALKHCHREVTLAVGACVLPGNELNRVEEEWEKGHVAGAQEGQQQPAVPHFERYRLCF